MKEPLQRIEAALEELRNGRMIIVRDDPGRENEGDLVCAAQHVTAEHITMMAVYGRGLICHAITRETAQRLGLDPMERENTDPHSTAFTVSVDAREGITTGISAEDRARTVQILADPSSSPGDLRRPGHLFPLVARDGGVLERRGHTEAAVDLARLAGLHPSGVICEIMNDDGTMACGAELEEFARRHNLLLVSVEDLIAYRDAVGDVSVTESSAAQLPTPEGVFSVTAFQTGDPASREVLLLEHPGEGISDDPPVVRLHSECLTGEAFHSLRCDCGPQLRDALRHIAAEGGALVYLRQEGRGIGLFEKIRAYTLQDQGMDTVEANEALGHPVDLRRFGVAAAILRHRGYATVRLMTNNPEKVAALERAGITVRARLPLHTGHTRENQHYIRTKEVRLGHYREEYAHEVSHH